MDTEAERNAMNTPTKLLPARRAVAAFAAVCLVGAALPGQRLPRRSVPQPIDFATSQNDNLFSLVRSQDDIHVLESALAELADGRAEPAVRRLLELLREEEGGVVPVAPGRFLGLRHAVVTTLANLPPAAAEIYRLLAQREAGDLFDRPLTALSPRQLAAIAERFPGTRRALLARFRLGDLLLEAGDGLRAAEQYRAAIDAAPIGSADERRAAERLACAGVLAEPAAARAAAESGLLPKSGDDVLAVANPPQPTYGAIGGGRSGATPMAEPVGRPVGYWHQDVIAPGFDQREKGDLAMFPVGDLDTLFVDTGREVVAYEPLRRRVAWVSTSPLRDLDQDAWQNRGRDEYEATVNQDMVLAPAVGGDVVVAALQVPDKSVTVDFQASFRIMHKIPQRRLFAFARQSGKLLWSHFDQLDGPRTRRFRGHDSCGPPLIAGDTVYAPIHDRSGAIAFSVAAYDLATGQPRWRRLVCSSQQDVNMFGNARQEFAASPLALADGVLYGSTNLGVAFAIDAEDGRIRWISAYDVVRMPRAMLHGQADRQVFFANNAPAVKDRVVCCTPLDSQFALGLDADTGEILWRLLYDARVDRIENNVVWLCGAIDDEFVLSGSGTVAVKARPDDPFRDSPIVRQLVRPDQLRSRPTAQLPARPAVTGDHVWIATRDRLLAFDRAGDPRAELPAIDVDGYLPGNLLLVDGAAVSIRQRNLDVVLDPLALLQRSEQRVRDAPDDPAALLRLAGLRRALLAGDPSASDDGAIQQLYRRGLAACVRRGLPVNHPVRAALQRELFEQALLDAAASERAGRPDALQRLTEARDLAPDTDRWIEVQMQVLQRCRDARDRLLQELDRLEQRAPAARLPDGVPVGAYVLWQRALAKADDPTEAVALWQQLLTGYGDLRIGDEPAAAVAEAAIAELIATRGEAVYAAVAARADAALAAAGADAGALEQVVRDFPNSGAARRARLLLLDRAVDEGNLAVACGVLARSLGTGGVSAAVLRRVQIAAERRGNPALADAMARLLAPFGAERSDWPADAGATYADVLRARTAAQAAPPARLVPPERDVGTVAPRSRQEYVSLMTTIVPDGFVPPADAPLYARAGSDLVAVDVLAKARQKPFLFAVPHEFLEHVLLCGETLVVPDTEQLMAVDYRSGAPRWQAAFPDQRSPESLGVTDGVLHVSVQPVIPDGRSELLGIEPLTGAVLFSRALSEQQLKPKVVDHQLLLMSTTGGGTTIERLDPVTGRTLAVVSYAKALGPGLLDLRPDSLATRLYPQGLCADDERLFLPADGRDPTAPPQLLALDAAGEIAWRWRGTAGAQLLMWQRRGDRLVLAEGSEQRPCRMLLLDAATGAVVREVELGYDAAILNWERSWTANPAPPIVAVDALVDRQSRQRQLVCFAVGDGPTFLVPLGVDDGEIERGPLFGDDFVTFGVRSARAGGPFRLYAIDLATRAGRFAGDRKYRLVETRAAPHGMTAAGPYTVLSTAQGLLLLGGDDR